MKKCIAFAAALILLTASGCGSNPAEFTPAETAQVTSAAETETTAAAETTFRTTETTTESTAAETTETTSAAPDTSAEDTLTFQLLQKIETWDKGHVLVNFGVEQDGISTTVSLTQMGKKNHFKMKLVSFEMEMCSDGEKVWMLDNRRKTYSEEKVGAEVGADEMAPENALEEASMGRFLGSGKDTYNGKECTYEDFKLKDETKDQTMRFFYDADGNVLGAKITDADTGEYFMNYSVEFTENTDESPFRLPEGYTEITTDEMSQQIMNDMFEMLAELMGAAEANE